VQRDETDAAVQRYHPLELLVDSFK
jgi:hypothetical protein